MKNTKSGNDCGGRDSRSSGPSQGNESIAEGPLHEGRMFFVARKRDAREPRGPRPPDAFRESVTLPERSSDPLPEEELKSWEDG